LDRTGTVTEPIVARSARHGAARRAING